VGIGLSRESRADIYCDAHWQNQSRSATSQSENTRDMRDGARRGDSDRVRPSTERNYRICAQCNADDEPLHPTKEGNTIVYLHAECKRFWDAEHRDS
jgi:hypothetical protein